MPDVAIQAASVFFTYFSYLSKVLTNISHQKIFKFAPSFGATFPIFFCAEVAQKIGKVYFAQLLDFLSATFWGDSFAMLKQCASVGDISS